MYVRKIHLFLSSIKKGCTQEKTGPFFYLRVYLSTRLFAIPDRKTDSEIYTAFHKNGDIILMLISLSILNRVLQLFRRVIFYCSKTDNLKIPPLFAYVATLPCETLMSEKKRLTINDKVR